MAERTELGQWRRWITAGVRGRTLDVGTGTGRNLPLFPASTFVVAIDPSLEALHRARCQAPRIAVIAASVEALPFRDTVASGTAFCSVPDPARGLAELRRVLRPTGQLRTRGQVRSGGRWRGRCEDVLEPAWIRITGGSHPNRESSGAVEGAGSRIEPDGRCTPGSLRRFCAVCRL